MKLCAKVRLVENVPRERKATARSRGVSAHVKQGNLRLVHGAGKVRSNGNLRAQAKDWLPWGTYQGKAGHDAA